MTQASSQWRQLVNLTQALSIPKFPSTHLSLQRWQGSGRWLLGVAGAGALLLWNWRLVLAIASGILVMTLAQALQVWNWQPGWSRLRRLFSSTNRPLVMVVGSGAITTFSSYMALAIWADSGSFWIALGMTLQGMGTLAVLGIGLGQLMGRPAHRKDLAFGDRLSHLTDANPLKRLIAVRQMTRLVSSAALEPQQCLEIADCFRLMLSQESEPVVRDAVLDGLQVLNQSRTLASGRA
ncbi:MAG: hypothetical protein VKJ46_12845, partial [Leptolyngbyaceae bacterium]|nr:hypothetical protein [Leptolyngbyaceae bacterium]